MEINNTKEFTLEFLKYYHDIIQNDIQNTIKQLIKNEDDSHKKVTILATGLTIAVTVRVHTDDLIEHIERDI